MASMTQAAKDARAAYMREWRKRNPDKVREYDARKWARKAAENATKPDKDGHGAD